MNTEIKGILFDLDNTLIDRQAAADAKIRSLVRSLLPQLEEGSAEQENAVQRLLNWDEFGSIDKHHTFGMFVREYGLADDTTEQLCRDWQETFGDYTVPFEKSRAVVENLRQRYRVGIVTNGSPLMQHRKMELSGLEDLFDVVIISGEFGAHKPEISIFLEGARQLGLAPQQIAFIGDTYGTDIIGAYRAGMHPVWICPDPSRTSQSKDAKRIYRIEDLLELL